MELCVVLQPVATTTDLNFKRCIFWYKLSHNKHCLIVCKLSVSNIVIKLSIAC